MNKVKLFLMVLVLSGAALYIPEKLSAQQVNVSFSVFQNELGRYGRWVNVPRYGQVWIYSEPGFRPYSTNGHWEYTNFGWSWVSDYPWGWAPFHYGRWELDPYYGWIWIPDYDWAPAWVTWSQYNGGYGWAPLGFGLSVNISFGAIPYDRWIFVPRKDICRPDVYRYRVTPKVTNIRNAVVINNIYVNNNIRFAQGPQRQEVERFTRSRIPERKIEYGRPPQVIADNHRPSNGNPANNIQRPTRPTVSGTTPTPGDNGRNDRPGIQRPDDRRPGVAAGRPGGSGSAGTNNDRRPDNTDNNRAANPVRRPGGATVPSGNRGNNLPERSRERLEAATPGSVTPRENAQPSRATNFPSRSGESSQPPRSSNVPSGERAQPSRPANFPSRTVSPRESTQPSRPSSIGGYQRGSQRESGAASRPGGSGSRAQQERSNHRP